MLNTIRQEEDFYFTAHFLAKDAYNHSKNAFLGDILLFLEGRTPTLLRGSLLFSGWTSYRGPLGAAGHNLELYIRENSISSEILV